MSMDTWHNYGYGICTDKIDTTIEQVRAFIDSEPEYKEKVLDWLKEEYLSDYSDETLPLDEKLNELYTNISLDGIIEIAENHDDYAETGMSCIIRSVISQKTGIPLISAKDYNSELTYVIMPSYYPWEVNRNAALRHINNDAYLKAVFEQHIAVLTNQTLDELDWGEQEIEGWG